VRVRNGVLYCAMGRHCIRNMSSLILTCVLFSDHSTNRTGCRDGRAAGPGNMIRLAVLVSREESVPVLLVKGCDPVNSVSC